MASGLIQAKTSPMSAIGFPERGRAVEVVGSVAERVISRTPRDEPSASSEQSEFLQKVPLYETELVTREADTGAICGAVSRALRTPSATFPACDTLEPVRGVDDVPPVASNQSVAVR